MAGIKISGLPAVASSLFTDYAPFVQGGVTSRATLLQVATLFGFNSGTGLLGLANGGTNANLTAALGAIPYSTASAFALLAPGTAGQLFQSGGAGAPVWTTATYPATAGTSGNVLVSNGTNWSSSTTTLISALGSQAQALNMNSHLINNVTDPVSAQDAATKAYVDAVAQGITVQGACLAGTTGALTATYSNGVSGVGATLTNSGALAAFSTDGVSPAINSRILVKDQAAPAQNGIYTLTTVGSGAVAWVLTRATDYDQASEIQPGDLVLITSGTTLASSSWIETATVVTIGTDSISFSQFSASLPISVPNGGTGRTTSTTAYGLIAAGTTATGALQTLATGSSGQVLQSSGASALPAYSTATYPSTATGTGTILRANGTNWASTTSTFADTYGVSTILYASSANVITGLATANSGVLVTSSGGVPSISSTLPTNIAMTTPLITTGVKDSNGNSMFGFTASASAVNYFNFANAPAAGTPVLSAIGSDSDISLIITGKGTGDVQIKGTGTNNNAPAGYVGEVISSAIPTASQVSVTPSGTTVNVTSISLTAGDWDVSGMVSCDGSGGTTIVNIFVGGINTVSATLPTEAANINSSVAYVVAPSTGWTVGSTGVPTAILNPCRISISGTTTVYLVARIFFTVSTAAAYGSIMARRVR